MMFNGGEVEKMNSHHANVVTSDVVIAAMFDEMQRNMQQNQEGTPIAVDESQLMIAEDSQNNSMSCDNFIPFKGPECQPLARKATDPVDISSDQASLFIVNNDNNTMNNGDAVMNNGDTALNNGNTALDDGNTVLNDDVVILHDDGNVRNDDGNVLNDDVNVLNSDQANTVDLPDNWELSILEANGTISENGELSAAPEQSLQQLWECSKCTALFREKEECEIHVTNAHDFSCSLCNEPFEEKTAFENHIVQHITEFQAMDSPPKPVPNDVKPIADNHSPKSKKRKLNDTSVDAETQISHFNSSEDYPPETPSDSVKRETSPQPSTSFQVPNVKSKDDHQFMCDICGKQCYTQHSFIMHLTKRHAEVAQYEFKCTICNADFVSNFALNRHQASQHPKPKSVTTPSPVSRPPSKHAPKSSGPKNFRCHTCDERFSSAVLLKEHFRTHEEVYPFPCDFCSEKYKFSAGLLNHIKLTHPNGREFRCPECSKSFKSKLYLEVHVSEVHAMERKKCRYCSRTYKTYDALLTHVQEAHDREESKHYDCDYCSQSFSNSRELKRHNEIHLMTIQTYDCDICAQTFANSTELKRHVKIAHESQPTAVFDCDWCSRSFGHKDNLLVHMKTHHRPMYNQMMQQA